VKEIRPEKTRKGNYQTLARTTYTGCPEGNVPDFGRMFLKLKYTDLIKNTYIRS